jgi:hypothetical protein
LRRSLKSTALRFVSRSAFQFDACTPMKTPTMTTSKSIATVVQSRRRRFVIT